MALHANELEAALAATKTLEHLQKTTPGELIAVRRIRDGALTRLEYSYQEGVTIVDVQELDNNPALMFLSQPASYIADSDTLVPTTCGELLHALEQTFGASADVELRVTQLAKQALLQAENAPNFRDFVKNEALSTFEVTSALDLYKLLRSTTITQYTVNKRPRLCSTVIIQDNNTYEGRYQGHLQLNLVKNSQLGQLVANTTGKHQVAGLLNALLRESDECKAYEQREARQQLAVGELDNAYLLLEKLKQHSGPSVVLYYKQLGDGYEVELDTNDGVVSLPEIASNRLITNIFDEEHPWRSRAEEYDSLYTCTVEAKLEEKFGTWRELKLLALLQD